MNHQVKKSENCIEFSFRIPFMEDEDIIFGEISSKEILLAWKSVCIRALEARMDSCLSLLYNNKERVRIANEYQILFIRENGHLHAFNIKSFEEMNQLVDSFKNDKLSFSSPIQINQLMKALYLVPEKERTDHGGFSFAELISALDNERSREMYQ